MLTGLPDAAFVVAPELRLLKGRGEPRAACDACPVSVPPDQLSEHPSLFRDDARCCTYHPKLFPWQAGRALRDPDSAPRVQARLQDARGVSADGIGPPTPSWVSKEQFGRHLTDRCPYWAGGALACGIWRHRTAVCRVWFCRVEDAKRSLAAWSEAKRLMFLIAQALDARCRALEPPPADGVPAEEMARWFVRCAERVEAMPAAEAATLRTPEIDRAARDLEAALEAVGMPVPDIVTASIQDVVHLASGRIRLAGYSLIDTVEVPAEIFRFIGRLDGQTTWRDALAAARADGLVFSDADVENLFRRGVVRPPRSRSLEPGAQLTINNQIV